MSAMTLSLERRNVLRLGSCPRCGSPLRLSALRVRPEVPMVTCSKEWVIRRGKRVGFCGFLWFAPWTEEVASDLTGAPRRTVRQVAVSVPTSGVPVPVSGVPLIEPPTP